VNSIRNKAKGGRVTNTVDAKKPTRTKPKAIAKKARTKPTASTPLIKQTLNVDGRKLKLKFCKNGTEAFKGPKSTPCHPDKRMHEPLKSFDYHMPMALSTSISQTARHGAFDFRHKKW